MWQNSRSFSACSSDRIPAASSLRKVVMAACCTNGCESSSLATTAAAWTAVSMDVVVAGRHVFRARVPGPQGGGDFEYYVRMRALAFPTLGADAAITVVAV